MTRTEFSATGMQADCSRPGIPGALQAAALLVFAMAPLSPAQGGPGEGIPWKPLASQLVAAGERPSPLAGAWSKESLQIHKGREPGFSAGCSNESVSTEMTVRRIPPSSVLVRVKALSLSLLEEDVEYGIVANDPVGDLMAYSAMIDRARPESGTKRLEIVVLFQEISVHLKMESKAGDAEADGKLRREADRLRRIVKDNVSAKYTEIQDHPLLGGRK